MSKSFLKSSSSRQKRFSNKSSAHHPKPILFNHTILSAGRIYLVGKPFWILLYVLDLRPLHHCTRGGSVGCILLLEHIAAVSKLFLNAMSWR